MCTHFGCSTQCRQCNSCNDNDIQAKKTLKKSCHIGVTPAKGHSWRCPLSDIRGLENRSRQPNRLLLNNRTLTLQFTETAAAAPGTDILTCAPSAVPRSATFPSPPKLALPARVPPPGTASQRPAQPRAAARTKPIATTASRL